MRRGKEKRRKEKRREGGKKEWREEDKGRIIYGYRNMYSETLKVLIRLANLHLQVYTFKQIHHSLIFSPRLGRYQ